jgi:hypothetical protein
MATLGTTVFLNNGWLNTIKSTGTSFNVAGAIGVVLHTGIPGATGASFVSSQSEKHAITFLSSTLSVLTQTGTPQWTNWTGTNGEVVSHVSIWDTSGTGGNCLWTAQLSASKTINTGDTFTLSSSSLTIASASN